MNLLSVLKITPAPKQVLLLPHNVNPIPNTPSKVLLNVPIVPININTVQTVIKMAVLKTDVPQVMPISQVNASLVLISMAKAALNATPHNV